MDLTFDIDLSQFAAALSQVGAALADVSTGAMRAGVEEAGERFAEYQLERFDVLGVGGSFDGDSWEPLKPATLRDRESKGFGDTPSLVRLGLIRDDLIPGGPGHYVEWHTDGVTHGVDNTIAGYQHFGTSVIPPRPIVGEANDQVTNDVETILSNAVAATIASIYGIP